MWEKVSEFEEFIVQLRPTLPKSTTLAQAIHPHEPWQQIEMKAIDGGHIEFSDESLRLNDAREIRLHYRAKPFKDQRCPICGRFACGGC